MKVIVQPNEIGVLITADNRIIVVTPVAGNYTEKYTEELVASPTSGTLILKNATITVLATALTSSNSFTVALPTPVNLKVNESILIFEIGATLPTITLPVRVVYYGKTLTLAINKKFVIYFLQTKKTAGYEIQVRADNNV